MSEDTSMMKFSQRPAQFFPELWVKLWRQRGNRQTTNRQTNEN